MTSEAKAAADITPEALEAAGFRQSLRGGFLMAAGLDTVLITQGVCGNWWFRCASFSGPSLPREVTTMTEIHELIRVLKGAKA